MEKENKKRKMNKLFVIFVFAFLLVGGVVMGAIIWSGGTNVNFEISSGTPVCDLERFVWKWWNGSEQVENNSLIDCFKDDGWPSTTCCPETSSCILSIGPGFNTCTGPPSPDYCADYTDSDSCLGFNYNVANRSMIDISGINNICGGYMESDVIGLETCWRFSFDCRCVWESGECKPQASWTNWTCPGDEDITVSGNCSFDEISKIDDCQDSGYISYSWESNWFGEASEQPGWCSDTERRFRCSTRLAFFTAIGFIIVVLLVIIIYYVLERKKGRKRGEKKKKIRKRGKR